MKRILKKSLQVHEVRYLAGRKKFQEKSESYQIRWGEPLQNYALLSRVRKVMCFLSSTVLA